MNQPRTPAGSGIDLDRSIADDEEFGIALRAYENTPFQSRAPLIESIMKWHHAEIARRAPFPHTGTGQDELTVEEVVELAEDSEYEDPESGKKCFDRLGFAKAVERAALVSRAASGGTDQAQPGKFCGAFECKAGQRDGIICAEGECDIASGVRAGGTDLAMGEQANRAGGQAMSDAELDQLADAFKIEADADGDAELRAGGPKRLIAFDYYKRGYLAARAAATLAHQAGAPVEPIYQVQMPGEHKSSVWRDASEAAYHTFTPEHRRILYATPAGAKLGADDARDAEQDAKDAARYRWLRYADLDALAAGNWKTGQVFEGVKFDDAIDAAMAASPTSDTKGGAA